MATATLTTRRVRVSGTRLARRVGAPLGTILAATVLVYVALAAAPGDPVVAVLGPRATPEQYAALRGELGLDQPLPVRFWNWLTSALSGDFGNSLTYRGQPAMSLIEPRLGTTLLLVAYAGVLFVVAGVGLGLLGGAFRTLGAPVAALTGIGVGVPGFVAAQLLIAVLAVQLGWFPTQGAGDPGLDRIQHLTLPAVTLSLSYTAYLAQVTRTAVMEERGRPHVETATGRGLPPGWVFRRHVVRNAAIPIVTVATLAVAGLFSGAVVVEFAFGIGGLGSLLIRSVASKDYNVVLAISVLLIVVFVVATTLIDAAQTWLDPRQRGRRST